MRCLLYYEAALWVLALHSGGFPFSCGAGGGAAGVRGGGDWPFFGHSSAARPPGGDRGVGRCSGARAGAGPRCGLGRSADRPGGTGRPQQPGPGSLRLGPGDGLPPCIRGPEACKGVARDFRRSSGRQGRLPHCFVRPGASSRPGSKGERRGQRSPPWRSLRRSKQR